MTDSKDQTPASGPSTTPSWVDEVLGSSGAAPGSPPSDLRLPGDQTPRPAAPSWVDDLAASPTAPFPPASPLSAAAQPAPYAAPTAYAPAPEDDWVTRATGGARTPAMPQGPAASHAPVQSGFDHFGDPSRQLAPSSTPALSGDAAQKKLIAGLLAIFLGSLGVHKFYLGLTTPGLITLGVGVGVWVLALLLGILTFGVGLFITLPLAALVSGALGLLGLVEGLIYLTKNDTDFQRDYLVGRKAWL